MSDTPKAEPFPALASGDLLAALRELHDNLTFRKRASLEKAREAKIQSEVYDEAAMELERKMVELEKRATPMIRVPSKSG